MLDELQRRSPDGDLAVGEFERETRSTAVPTENLVLIAAVDDIGIRRYASCRDVFASDLGPSDPSNICTFSCGAATRDTRLAAPTPGPSTVTPPACPLDASRPAALDVGVADLDGMAIGNRHRWPETVIAWHRRAFRRFWSWKSRHRIGRPAVPADVRAMIRRMSQANPQ